MQLTQPDPTVSTTTVADVDAVAAGAVIDLLREVELVLETLGATPVPELRSGGLGVRDVKRLTKVTGIDEARLGLILEVSSAAGLIAAGLPEPDPHDGVGPYWAPTVAADRFVESPTASKWHLLASTWLDLPGRPSLIGSRGPDGKPYAALSDSLFSTAAPLDRRLLLDVLADLPAGRGCGRYLRVTRDDLATPPLGGAPAARPGRRPADRGACVGCGRPRRDCVTGAEDAGRRPGGRRHRGDGRRCCPRRSTTSCCRPT